MHHSRPRIGWFRALARYYRDPSASVLGKLVIFAALIYAVVPVDLIPDVPIIGWLDDLGVMGLATMWLSRVVSKYRDLPVLDESFLVRGGSEDSAPSSSPVFSLASLDEKPIRKPFSVSP